MRVIVRDMKKEVVYELDISELDIKKLEEILEKLKKKTQKAKNTDLKQ